MRIEVVDLIDGQLLDTAWTQYSEAFSGLRTTAVQRHVMHRDEFDAMMTDRRVRKFLAWSPQGELHGLSTFTNHLDAIPLISPDYFRARFPDRYSARQIWYVGFVAVHREGRQPQIFERLITAMRHHGGDQLAMVVIDVCRLNGEELRLPDAVGLILRRRFGDVRRDRLDEQTYWGYTFPPDQIAAA
ncbi:hypothetical protein GCM10010399_44780 [Dactylosporangium fulvum]|uniref:N-acetyltransferase domain-containing protein n=1 Tax=Dactylosporangium fulvum TaxID=53359 RepID=A0ABY5W7T1_9ACTN|nr:hypothetical protein [Dactylosporangium fulvum]UWP86138.1 hypothetical protein Dfulv_18590 [Dactylosporangium fulvum]